MKNALHAVFLIAGLGLMSPVLACDADNSNAAHANMAAPSSQATHYASAAPVAAKSAQPRRYIEAFE